VSTQVVPAAETATDPISPAPVNAANPWRRAWIVGGATWAAAVLGYFIVTITSWMVSDRQGPPMGQLYQAWDHWDTGHYMRISQVGYTPDRPDTHAFFPLFPLLLRVVDTIVPGPTLVASLVLSNLACIGALVMLHRFAAREFDATVADRTVLFLMAWPTAFFLSAGYNGSLFMLLSAAALYCMRAGSWWAAGGLGALASGTRLSGVLLCLAFVIEYARQHREPGTAPAREVPGPPHSRPTWRSRMQGALSWRPRAWRLDAAAILLIPTGLVAFSIYMWITLGDPLAFSHAQDFWGRRLAPPWGGIIDAWQAVLDNPLLKQVALHNLLDVGFATVSIALLLACVVGPWRLPRDQLSLIGYSAASYLIVLTGPVAGMFPIQGAGRYSLELIPIFFLLARLGASRVFERLYLFPAVGLQAVFLLTFLNNVWVG
jgi:hypothetical protein